MQIAIHNHPGSFSDRWITYCESNNINYKIVSCYDSDIIQQLEDCDGLMWHWRQEDYQAVLFARQLTFSLEKKGIKVFPDSNTSWHFDDKIGQKYLLEAINAPFVNSYVFYSKQDAKNWISKTTFPKVFKLRGGAGSINVSLVRTNKKARKLVKRAFGKGFSTNNMVSRLKDRFWVLRRDKDMAALNGVFKGLGRFVLPTKFAQFSPKQKGYVYFQDFVPGNNCDIRLVVIGNRCFGFLRYCRKGDFRASGSGMFGYGRDLIELRCVQYAFETAIELKSQCIAFDFVMLNNEPKIIEISYGLIVGRSYTNCPGYWDDTLQWHEKPVSPHDFIIEDFICELNRKKNTTEMKEPSQKLVSTTRRHDF